MVKATAPARPGRPADLEEVTWALPDLPDVLLVPHDWTTYSGAVMSLVEEGRACVR